ncbi:MAG: hypothetical protein E6J41_03280 [Chloroflexi bacterium]|nr:MAG: hypothetical protein E6J41_03280 [Chloroflexota bacterium]
MIVLRNAYALGVINGTLGTVTAIDRDRGDIRMQTIESEPREVRLPATFWNAAGRRRLALAYCRTIFKAQGSTYRGASFTLAGDDTIHLEALHVALSRGTAANHLYYVGEPPPDEDHHAAEIAEPEFESLVAAAGRSRAQVMALDFLEGSPSTSGTTGVPAVHWTDAPMTEAQVATLARRGEVPTRDLTWVQASLLIDRVAGTPPGQRARSWLRENGADAEEAARVVDRAERELRQPPAARPAHALDVRLEVLDGADRSGRRPSARETRERESLLRWQASALRERVRTRREEWARRSTAAENGSQAVVTGRETSRPPPRTAR